VITKPSSTHSSQLQRADRPPDEIREQVKAVGGLGESEFEGRVRGDSEACEGYLDDLVGHPTRIPGRNVPQPRRSRPFYDHGAHLSASSAQS
jgi:hypothetical protein